MLENDHLDEAAIKAKMQSSVEAYKKELSGLRAGRASPALLEKLQVDAYGSKMPLSQLASTSNLDAQTLQITVWDQENIKPIEKAISNSALDVTPNSEGNVIRITLPSLSEERRNDLSKLASKAAENYRIAVRTTRRGYIDSLRAKEKESSLSKDELHKATDIIESITKEYIAKIDELLAQKIQDIQLN